MTWMTRPSRCSSLLQPMTRALNVARLNVGFEPIRSVARLSLREAVQEVKHGAAHEDAA